MACQLRAPTKEVFHNRPGHLITFQAEFSLRGLPSSETLTVTSYLLFVFMPPVLSPWPLFSLCFKEVILSSVIYQRSFCFELQYKINHKRQQLIDLVGTDNTDSKLRHFRWHAIGPTMKTVFHLVSVQRLFCEIWVNFVSQLEWKANGFVLPSVLWRSAVSPISHPGCAWKRLRWSAGVGDISSEFITVQSLYNGSHSTLAFVFPPMKIVHTMSNLIHCQCSSWNIANETTVNQLHPGRKRGRYWDSQRKLKFALILCGIFHPGHSSLRQELMETMFGQL